MMKNEFTIRDFNSPDNANLIKLIFQINEKLNDDTSQQLMEKWIPKKNLMRYLDCGETTMRKIENEYKLLVRYINKKKFYNVPFILSILEENIPVG